MRKNYAEAAAQGNSIESPGQGDFFATILSPNGKVRIADRSYRLDFANRRVYCIHQSQASALYGELIEGPNTYKIRYYPFDEEVLNLIGSEGQGTSASQSRNSGIGIGAFCGLVARLGADAG